MLSTVETNIVLLLQVVKQTVMTVVYGVTWVGGRRQVEVIYFSWKFFLCVGNLGTVYPIDYTRVWGKGVKLKCSITDISFELLHNGVQVLSLYSS